MVRAPRCPYCHETVLHGEALVVCRECHAFHHELCFTEGSGCSACLRAMIMTYVRPPGWKRLMPALTLVGGFFVGELVGAQGNVVRRTSETEEPVAMKTTEPAVVREPIVLSPPCRGRWH